MNVIRQHILSRLLCVLMALHIFNVSIDVPDAQPDYLPEDLSINDQESFVELVLEKWLGFEHAVAEHDEPGDESRDFEISKEFKFHSGNTAQIAFVRPFTRIITLPYKENLYSRYFREINPPPPKA